MKENILDVLMYLFENYMDDEVDMTPDKDSLKLELQQAGFPHGEVDKALAWLEGLTSLREDPIKRNIQNKHSIRIFSKEEIKKLSVECRGFLLFLEQVEVLDQATREMVIDRVMALETDDIQLEQLQWVVLMVLFNQPGQEAAFAWMEDFVMDEQAASVH